jgi:hypothetical protein
VRECTRPLAFRGRTIVQLVPRVGIPRVPGETKIVSRQEIVQGKLVVRRGRKARDLQNRKIEDRPAADPRRRFYTQEVWS